MLEHIQMLQYIQKHMHHQTSNISCTKSQNLTVSHLAIVFAQSIYARCSVENVGAAPTGAVPTTSEWSTVVLPIKVPLILDVWQYTLHALFCCGLGTDQKIFMDGYMLFCRKRRNDTQDMPHIKQWLLLLSTATAKITVLLDASDIYSYCLPRTTMSQHIRTDTDQNFHHWLHWGLSFW